MRKKIKTIIIEDENVLREMFVRILSEADGFEVIGDWKDAESALINIERVSPDVAIVDYRLPGMNGIELTKKLSERCPGIKTLILTADMRSSLAEKAFSAGATGFLNKATGLEELFFAIKTVGKGSTYLCTDLVKDVVLFKASHVEEGLSPECISILKLFAEGFENKEIGERLQIPQDTLKYRFAQIKKVLDARDRTNALYKAMKMGIIDSND